MSDLACRSLADLSNADELLEMSCFKSFPSSAELLVQEAVRDKTLLRLLETSKHSLSPFYADLKMRSSLLSNRWKAWSSPGGETMWSASAALPAHILRGGAHNSAWLWTAKAEERKKSYSLDAETHLSLFLFPLFSFSSVLQGLPSSAFSPGPQS